MYQKNILVLLSSISSFFREENHKTPNKTAPLTKLQTIYIVLEYAPIHILLKLVDLGFFQSVHLIFTYPLSTPQWYYWLITHTK